MSRKAGEIKVRSSASQISRTAVWLRTRAIPYQEMRPKTLLGSACKELHLQQLRGLALKLQRSAHRKRASPHLTLTLTQQDAASFVSAVDAMLVLNQLGAASILPPLQVRQVTEQMRAAISPRRGPKTHTEQQRLVRLSPNYHIDPRQRKRVRAQLRSEQRLDGWFEEIRERGETILTTKIPLPAK